MTVRKAFAMLAGLLCAGCESQAERQVKAYLVDPESAQFSEVVTENGVTCGVVNSKNQMGGYTGQRTFIIRDGRVLFVGDPYYLEAMQVAPCTIEAVMVRVRENSVR